MKFTVTIHYRDGETNILDRMDSLEEAQQYAAKYADSSPSVEKCTISVVLQEFVNTTGGVQVR